MYQMDNTKKQEEIARHQSTIQQQEDQIADLRQELAQHKNNTTSVQAVLKQQLKQKEDEINTLKETKSAEKRKRKEAEKEKDRATTKMETTKKDLEQAHKEIAELKSKLTRITEEKEEIQTRLDKTEQINDHLIKQYISKNETYSTDDEETDTAPKCPKIMLICDSNRKKTSPDTSTPP